MSERKRRQRTQPVWIVRLLAGAQRCRDQQRLVVQNDLGRPVGPEHGFEIDPVAAEDRRPHQHRLVRTDQPLAADRDQHDLVAGDPRPAENALQPLAHRNHELCRAVRIVRPLLAEPVDQRAGIIHQRILHAIRRNDDDDQIAAIAPLPELDPWPPSPAGRLLLGFLDHLSLFEVGRDGGNRRGGKRCEIRKLSMGQRAMPAQGGKHQHAVALPHQLRTRLGQHKGRPIPACIPPSFTRHLRQLSGANHLAGSAVLTVEKFSDT
jgi:hypothetical protein